MAGSTPSTENDPLDVPLGVRAAEFLLDNLVSVAAFTVFFGFIGLAAALLVPRPYVDSAVVEVGERPIDQPLVHPIQVGWELRGSMLDRARTLGLEIETSVTHRREEKTNALTRFMDVSIRSESATTARAIFDRSLSELLERHEKAHAFEMKVMEEQLTLLQRASARLDRTLREGLPAEEDFQTRGERRAELDALNARLFSLHSAEQTVRAAMSALHTPPTRIVARAAKVEREPSRSALWVIGGALFGFVLGVLIAAARFVLRVTQEQRPANTSAIDPLVADFLAFTQRNRWLILAAATVFALAGGVASSLRQPLQHGFVLVTIGQVAPDGPVVDLEAIEDQLQAHVARLVVGQHLAEDTELEAIVIRDQPPTSRKLPMVALRASSSEPAAVRVAIAKSLEHLRSLEEVMFAAEQRRLKQDLADLDAEVERLFDGPTSARTQEALQEAVFGRSMAAQRMSPARTHPSRILSKTPVEPESLWTQTIAITMLALVMGAAGGYVVAFLLDGLRRRRRLAPRPGGG